MTTFRMTINEWAFPVAVLISWMMATAYTVSRMI